MTNQTRNPNDPLAFADAMRGFKLAANPMMEGIGFGVLMGDTIIVCPSIYKAICIATPSELRNLLQGTKVMDLRNVHPPPWSISVWNFFPI